MTGKNDDRWAEYFAARKWRVAEEVSGNTRVNGVKVYFAKGRFTVEAPGAFRSPVSGNPGRIGVLLQEVGEDGADIADSLVPFGKPAVERARKEFNAIT